jgi:hypothetical protein
MMYADLVTLVVEVALRFYKVVHGTCINKPLFLYYSDYLKACCQLRTVWTCMKSLVTSLKRFALDEGE